MKKPHNEQTLKINYCVNLQSFHPHLVSDVRTHTISKALYEGLTRINLQGEVEFAAAEKVEISPCKKIYTFTLRPSKWSNGETVTSYHFAKAWEKAISPKSKCIHVKRFFIIKNAKKFYDGELSSKIGIYTPSDNTLIIELEHPASYFLQLVADAIYSPIYNVNLESDPIVFNGPFLMENYELNKQLTLISNPLYWDAGIVKLKKIQINFVKDIQTAFSMYENNQLDYLGSPFTNLPDEAITVLSNLKTQQSSAPFWFFFNVQNPKLKSSKIRKALAYAINRKEIIDYILPNQKEAMYSILPKELSTISEDPFLINLDIEQAQKFFAEGLKELGINKKDFQLTLSHSNSSEQEKISLYLKSQWEKIFEINIDLKRSDWNSFFSNLLSGNYEIGGAFNCNIYNDSSYFLESFQYFHSNYSKWENKDYQRYFTLAKQTLDEKQRKEFLKKAEEILLEEMPVIPIYNHAHLYLCKDGLENFSAPKFNYADFKYAYYTD